MSDGAKYIYKGTCKRCGSLFSSQVRKTQYCSMTCGAAHRKKEPVLCIQCGKPFKRHAIKKFCSRTCSGLARQGPRKIISERTLHEHTCQHCNTTYTSPKKTGTSYCSMLCRNAARRSPVITSEVYQEALRVCRVGSVYEFLKERGYGGRKAVNRTLKELGLAVPPKPKSEKRQNISSDIRHLKLAGCLICGEKRVVDLAHLIPHSWGGRLVLQNIVPLCPTHHKAYDKHLLSATEIFKLKEALLIKQQIETPAVVTDLFVLNSE